MSTTLGIDYDTAGNFTYDTATTEFSGSVVRLLDLRDSDATFAHSFNSLDASWGDGSLTAVSIGIIPTVSNNRIDVTGTTLTGLRFSSISNFAATQLGCIDFTYKPNYSGTPGTTATIFDISDGSGNTNRLVAHQSDAGNLEVEVYDSSDVNQGGISAAWVPVSGTEYRIQINWDLNTGATRLFVDGFQHGATSTNTGTRTTTGLIEMVLGTNRSETNLADGTIGSFAIYGAVQNTANYTVGSEINESAYSRANPSVLYDAGFSTDGIESFVETTSSKVGNDQIKYYFEIDSLNYWWNGTAWVISDGTYSQSNLPATVHTNGEHSSFPHGLVKPVALLHKDLTISTDVLSLTTITVIYSFYNTVTAPDKCTVWGYYLDVGGDPVIGATVTFELVKSKKQYREAGTVGNIIEKSVSVVTDENGRFDANLIRTSEYGTDMGTYYVSVVKEADGLETKVTSGQDKIEITVPDAVDENITDIITGVA